MKRSIIELDEVVPTWATVDAFLARYGETQAAHRPRFASEGPGAPFLHLPGYTCGSTLSSRSTTLPDYPVALFAHQVDEGLRLLAASTGLPATHDLALHQRLVMGGGITWREAADDVRPLTPAEAAITGHVGTVEGATSWMDYLRLVRSITSTGSH